MHLDFDPTRIWSINWTWLLPVWDFIWIQDPILWWFPFHMTGCSISITVHLTPACLTDGLGCAASDLSVYALVPVISTQRALNAVKSKATFRFTSPAEDLIWIPDSFVWHLFSGSCSPSDFIKCNLKFLFFHANPVPPTVFPHFNFQQLNSFTFQAKHLEVTSTPWFLSEYMLSFCQKILPFQLQTNPAKPFHQSPMPWLREASSPAWTLPRASEL